MNSELLHQLYTLEQEQKRIRRRQHRVVRISPLKNIADVISDCNFTKEQASLVHEYLQKADALDEMYNHKAEDVLEPYAGRIVSAVVSLSGFAGAAVGYAYALTKAHFSGEMEYDGIAISALAGIIMGYRPFGLLISHHLPAIKKIKADYRQEKKKLIEDTVSELSGNEN